MGRRGLAALVVLAAIAVACGGDEDESATDASFDEAESESSGGEAFSGAGDVEATVAADGAAVEVETGASGVPGVEIRSASQLAQGERSVIRTASLEVVVDDVEEASVRAIAAAEGAGGFLASQNSDLGDDPTSSLTFRVPPERFTGVLGDLAGLGELVRREVGSDDVTEEVVDLEGRREATEASVDRLRFLLADAGSVPDVVAIETELVRREAELEALTGQLRTLEGQVDLSTVSLLLTGTAPPGPEPEPAEGIPGFLDGLRRGAVLFIDGARVVLVVVGFALPFLALAALLWFPARLLLRTLRTRRARRPPRPQAPTYGGWPPPTAPATVPPPAGP